MKAFLATAAVLALSGCAINVAMMPRDSGTVYSGELQGNGMGGGTMTVKVDDAVCTGPVARVASNQSFGFANTYAADNRGNRAGAVTAVSTSGDHFVKAILSCSNGNGLRCDMTGRNNMGGGICVDNNGRVFDVIGTPK